MAVVERVYTVPLSGAYRYRRRGRAVRTVALLKEFLARHMKTDVESVRLDSSLNDYLWSHGMTRPPRKVKVKVKKGDDGVVDAYLLEGEREGKVGEKREAKAASGKKQKEVKEVNAENEAKAKRD